MVLIVVVAVGCSTTHNRESADREVYGVVAERTSAVPGMDPQFTIEEGEVSLEGLPKVTEEPVVAVDGGMTGRFLGEAGEDEVGSYMVSLEEALAIAVKNSREYQGRKEALYVQALAFTATRQQYRPVFSGRAGATYAVDTRDVTKRSGGARLAQAAPGLIEDLGGFTGASADLLSAYAQVVESAANATGASASHTAIEQDRSASGTTSFDVGVLLKGGARIAVGLSSNFFRFLTGDPQVSTSTVLVASIEQPLLGSNRRTAAEMLTQAERDVLYSLRSFARYRKSFSVRIASSYYRVLQSRDTVRNSWLGYEAFKKTLERRRAEADEGRITKSDLGRTIEEELQSRNAWITAIQQYQNGLDGFKMRLGLPTDAKIVLDDSELDRLLERGLMPAPSFLVEDAIEVAFASRLDYGTERDFVDDAARQVKLAADGLKPDLSIVMGGRVNSMPGDRFQELDFKRYAWDLGLDVDPKFNRKSVRNRYRAALINYASARRGLEEFEDQIKLDVRERWRALEQARVSYAIQNSSLAQSERRVLHQQLLYEEGRGDALDQIDAQNALIRARNSVSARLVDHTIANLDLWLDMGILYVKENGRWKDVTEEDLTDV